MPKETKTFQLNATIAANATGAFVKQELANIIDEFIGLEVDDGWDMDWAHIEISSDIDSIDDRSYADMLHNRHNIYEYNTVTMKVRGRK